MLYKTSAYFNIILFIIVIISLLFMLFIDKAINSIFIYTFVLLLFTVKAFSSNFSSPALYESIFLLYFILNASYINTKYGTFYLYFFFSLIVVLFNIEKSNLKKLLSVKTFRILLAMVIVILLSAMLSDDLRKAFQSSVFFILNSMTAFAVFLVLVRRKMSLCDFRNMIFKAVLLSVIFGIAQFLFFNLFGFPIGLGEAYLSNLQISQIPAFRYEANTFGKFVGYSIVFIIPKLVSSPSLGLYILLFLLLFILVISPTRSAIYSLVLTFSVFFLYHFILVLFKTRKIKANLTLSFMLFTMITIILFFGIFQNNYIRITGYSEYKLRNLFFIDVDFVKEDPSAAFRYQSLEKSIRKWQQNLKTILLGEGYGSAYEYLKGYGYYRVGSTDYSSLLVGTGLFGLAAYLSLYAWMFKKSFSMLRLSNNDKVLVNQILFVLLYFAFYGFFSGILNVPEFWMTIGIFAYLELSSKI